MKEHGKTIIDMLSVEFTEAEIQQLFEENGFERGLQLGREEGREEGLEKGREEGEKNALERLNKLNILLNGAGRTEDLFRSMEDPAYQQKLLEEFGL